MQCRFLNASDRLLVYETLTSDFFYYMYDKYALFILYTIINHHIIIIMAVAAVLSPHSRVTFRRARSVVAGSDLRVPLAV
jgi:hypothetical protein